MKYLPFILILVVLVVLLALGSRSRRRQAQAQTELAERIETGSPVMTTSGLHGTVVAKHEDGTVTLRIAEGVEVRWELAALRDAASLPERFADRAESESDGDAAGEPGLRREL